MKVTQEPSLAPEPGPGPTNRADRRAQRPRPCGKDVEHVGVVFIHGIGSQEPGATLREWSEPLINTLAVWRRENGERSDPVVTSDLASTDNELFIELDIPACADETGLHGPQHWVLTEAWWAGEVRPPTARLLFEWLGPRGAVARIADAFVRRRTGGLTARMSTEPRGRRSFREHSSDAGRDLARAAFGLFLSAIAATALLAYGAVRAILGIIPVAPFSNGAILRPVDDFLLNWFGDVYVLLNQPAAAADIRAALLRAIGSLDVYRPDRVVVIAHSAGAIVSYMTLADAANAGARVDKLITHGEAIALAWTLVDAYEPDSDAVVAFEGRLLGDLAKVRPGLRWVDIWASQDPAPNGPLRMPPSLTTESPSPPEGVWNRLSVGEDHGTYWDNEEEFVLPVLRELDSADPDATPSRFYHASLRPRSLRRRQRLGLLDLWRRWTSIGTITGILGAMVLVAGTRIAGLGRTAIDVASVIPGHEIVSAPLGAVQAGYRAGQPLDVPIAHLIVALGTAELPVLLVAAGIASLMNVVGPWGPWGVWSRRLLIILDIVPAIALLYVFTWIEVHPFTDWLDAIPDALSGWLAALVPGGSGSATGIGRAFIEAVELVVVAVLLTFLAGWVVRRLGPVVAALLSAIARRAAGHRTAETAGRSVILLGMVAVVVVAALLTLAPIAAMALDPDLGRLVVGAAVATALVALVARLGVWRWDQWDERERSAARRPVFVPLPRAHVVVQAVLLATALTLTVLWIVGLDAELEVGGFRPHLGSFALLASALVVLIGIALDVLGPRPDEPHDAPVFATDSA